MEICVQSIFDIGRDDIWGKQKVEFIVGGEGGSAVFERGHCCKRYWADSWPICLE